MMATHNTDHQIRAYEADVEEAIIDAYQLIERFFTNGISPSNERMLKESFIKTSRESNV